MEQGNDDLLLQTCLAPIAKQLKPIVQGVIVIEDMEHSFHQVVSHFLLEIHDASLVLTPRMHDATKTLLERKFNCTSESLAVGTELLLDRAEAVEVKHIKYCVLFTRHDQIADEVHQNDCALRVSSYLSNFVLQEFASLVCDSAPLSKDSSLGPTPKMAVS